MINILLALRGGVSVWGTAGWLEVGGDGGDGSYLLPLDAGDDPPVYEENEPIYGDEENHRISDRFSDWLLVGLFPVLRHVSAAGLDRDFEPIVLDFLTDRFAHSFALGWGGAKYQHFHGDGRWVRLGAEPRGQSPVRGGRAYWWVSALTEEGLRDLLAELWPFGGFAAGIGGFAQEATQIVRRLHEELLS